MANARHVNYGLTDAKMWVNNAGTFGTAIDIPGIRSMSADTDASTEIVRGDGRVIAVITTDRTANGTIEMASNNPAAFAGFTGGQVIASGTGPTAATHFIQSAGLFVPYVQLAGLVPVQTIDGGKDIFTVFQAKASGGPSLMFGEEVNYPSLDYDAVAYSSTEDGDPVFYMYSQYVAGATVLPTAAVTALPVAA